MDLKRCISRKGYVMVKEGKEYNGVVRQHEKYVAKAKRVGGLISELPLHILYIILSMLPMEAVFLCKCVCKTFLNIAKDPYFAELHLTRAPNVDHSLIVQNKLYPSDFSLAYLSDLKKRNHAVCWRKLALPPNIMDPDKRYSTMLAGPCNGLLCMYCVDKDKLAIFYVCNPILGEFMILPQNRPNGVYIGGLGFAPKKKLYKVVRFFNKTYCEIHTLGTNCWRRIDNAAYPYLVSSLDSSFIGNLHWISVRSNSYLIYSLDLETEKTCYISPPHCINNGHVKRKRLSSMFTGAINGLFCIFYMVDESQLEVCVMKEYGVESSWTKQFIVDLRLNNLRSVFIAPRLVLNNGDLLVRYNNTNYYYSSRKGTFEDLKTSEYCNLVVYAPSFVSLKAIVAGDEDNNHVVRVVRRTYLVGLFWSEEEVLRLLQGVDRNKWYDTENKLRVAWGQVAQQVATRTPNQCKSKWHYMQDA